MNFQKQISKGTFFIFHGIWRYIQDVSLETGYKNDVIFALQVRKISSLAYQPENEVIYAYEKLLDTVYSTQHDELLSPYMGIIFP